MAFSSLEFILVFLPVFLALNFIIPQKLRNAWLLVGSIGFYAYGTRNNPMYLVLLLTSVLVNYFAGAAIERHRSRAKLILVLAVLYDVAVLFLFKYADFFITNIYALVGVFTEIPKAPHLRFILPLGLSFYTFQAIAYVADVYKKRCEPAENIVDFGAFLCMFPKFVSGPIARFGDIRPRLRMRTFNLEGINDGLKRFTLGLVTKVVIADQVGRIWSEICKIGFDSISTPLAWMGIISYSVQLYLDFYGYSLMAIGVGEMVGFIIPVNFKNPYMAKSMTDFWRRWHITLGAWFRDYVYIPLGGSRSGKWKLIMSTAIVWLLTGLWHGANWNFVLWGAVLCVLILFEKLVLKGKLDRTKVVGHIYMLFAIPLTWLIFAVPRVKNIGVYLMRLFGLGKGINVYAGDFLQFSPVLLGVFVLGIILCTGVQEKLYEKFKNKAFMNVILLALFWLSMWCIYRGMSDPFMYFQF